MEHTLTKEDIITLATMLIVVYVVMTFFQKKLQAYLDDQINLLKWGAQLPLNENQYSCLMKLWIAFKKKSPPEEDLFEMLSNDELNQIKDYCNPDKLPQEFKKFCKKISKTEQNITQMGFSKDEATIICGLIFNKIGGIHSIKIKER